MIVSTSPWRTAVRIAILHAMVGGAAVISVGGMSAGVTPQEIATKGDGVAPVGESSGTDPAPDHSRIVASGQAEFGYSVPLVSIQEPEPPKVVIKRAISNNPIPQSVAGNAVLELAAQFVGTPYLAGGTTPAGFDCTGFVSYVYAQFGISLPHSSSSYWNIGTRVSAQDALPGDLIVSSGHVGIYAGGNQQIDAPRQGKTIQFRGIWQSSYIFVRVS